MQTLSVALLLIGCLALSVVTNRRGWRLGAATSAAVAVGFALLRAGAPGWDAGVELGTFVVVAALLVDAQRRERAERDHLAMLCDVDEATSCLNRRGFAGVLENEAARAVREQRDLALLALDLDHFKQVNDRFGHLVGDEVLREVGRTLAEQVGTRGVVARMGGEEFAVLLPGFDAEAAGVMAERILAELRGRQFASLPAGAGLTLSAGIAAERASALTIGAALRARSDEALYAAKRSGRDRALLWAPGVHSNSTPVRSSLLVDGSVGPARRPSGPWRAPA